MSTRYTLTIHLHSPDEVSDDGVMIYGQEPGGPCRRIVDRLAGHPFGRFDLTETDSVEIHNAATQLQNGNILVDRSKLAAAERD